MLFDVWWPDWRDLFCFWSLVLFDSTQAATVFIRDLTFMLLGFGNCCWGVKVRMVVQHYMSTILHSLDISFLRKSYLDNLRPIAF